MLTNCYLFRGAYYLPSTFNFFLFSIYFSKYLELPVNTITHQQKHVAQRLFLEDIGTWKLTYFVFAFFAFSTLQDFSEKTYEKCSLYNIFSKYISNDTRLTRFTIWLLFPKNLDCFNLMSNFFHFECRLQKKLWQYFLLYYNFQSYLFAASGKHYNAPRKACCSRLLFRRYWH